MNDTIRILKCPWCWSEAMMDTVDDDTAWGVFCPECGAAGPVETNKQCAADEWNRIAGMRQE